MMYRVVIEEEAEREFTEAVDYYDGREPGLGQRFARELRAFFETVCEDPERFRLAGQQTRKAKLPKPWPHSVYFVIKPESSEVIINAIWHGAQHLTKLRHRLK